MKYVFWILCYQFVFACTSAQKDAKEAVSPKKCDVPANDRPLLAILSTTELGGKGVGPVRALYTGDPPAVFVMYKSGTVIFARNVSRTNQKFYSYFCTKLSAPERKKIIEQYFVRTYLTETFEGVNAEVGNNNAPHTEILYFRSQFECNQLEFRGTIDKVRKYSQRSRSSVAPRVPEDLLAMVTELHNFNHPDASPYFPSQVLLEFRPYRKPKDANGKSLERPVTKWPEQYKLFKITDEDIKITPAKGVKHYTTTVDASQLRSFFTTLKAPILWANRQWSVGYRFLLPQDHYWASRYPTRTEEYSRCNRYISHVNAWTLYGLLYLK